LDRDVTVFEHALLGIDGTLALGLHRRYGWRIAAYSHLAADLVYSANRRYGVWGVPLGWQFAHDERAWPCVPRGDVGATLILAAGMFAQVRWPGRTQPLAAATLALVAAYVLIRRVMA
jgi:hypothetical protein